MGTLAVAGVACAVIVSCAGEPGSSDPADGGTDGSPVALDATVSDVAPGADAADAGIDAPVPLVDTCGDAGVPADTWVADPHLCVTVLADYRAVSAPRQLAFAPNGDLFVGTGVGLIFVLADKNKDGVIDPDDGEALQFTNAVPLTHGVAFSPDGAFVYASSASTIYRWPYKSGDRVATAPEEIVVDGMPEGGHFSRTLAFDAAGRLYVNVGSAGDVDLDPQDLALRSQVRRFTIPATLPAGGLAYAAGDVYASGLRNEVGLAFDSKGRMWGVENGSDGSYLPVQSQDNPAEELNRLDAPGTRFFGYPPCWTEFGFDGGMGKGTQWAMALPEPKTDAWCRDKSNVQPPAAAMPAHWAPLGVTEYAAGSLPWKGDLFITSHGSSGRVPPVGRLIARAHVVGDAVTTVTPIIGHLVDGGLEEGTWDARPVDIRVGPDGALYFSDDHLARVYRVGYRP